MSNFVKSVNKPEYLLQPKALFRRVFGKHLVDGIVTIMLPWKLPIEVDVSDVIGRTISHHGLFEMSVVETIFRLMDPADVFLDVGANIGYMSSVGVAAGAKNVFSFEPHPELFKQLDKNRLSWVVAYPLTFGSTCAYQMAVSTCKGTATLRFPTNEFSSNRGLASLENWREGDFSKVEVLTTTLAEILEKCDGKAGVMKIDIEGHELAAFEASMEVLRAGKIRDIIFEDNQGITSKVCVLLQTAGYTVFGINKTMFGPVLLKTAVDIARFDRRSYEGSQNFLASRDPIRAKQRMAKRGFKCLEHRNWAVHDLVLEPQPAS